MKHVSYNSKLVQLVFWIRTFLIQEMKDKASKWLRLDIHIVPDQSPGPET